MGIKRIKLGNYEFFNIANPRDSVLKNLIKAYNFNHLDLEDFESKTQISKIEVYEHYSLIVLDFPVFTTPKKYFEETEPHVVKKPFPVKFVKSTLSNLITIPTAVLAYPFIEHAHPEKKRIFHSQVYFFIGKDYVILLHDNELKIIEEIFSLCHKNASYRDDLMGKGPLFFTYRVIDALIDLCFPMINELSSKIEKIDRKLGKGSQDVLEDISVTRRNLVYFQTIIRPFIPILKCLEEGKYQPLNGGMSSYWSNLSDHVLNLEHRLENNRELIEGIAQSNESLINSRNNEIIAFLTIIFTLTVPATVIGSFFGMNILLPGGLETGPFKFWGDYTTFFLVIIASIIPVLGLLVYFKVKRWL